MSTRIRIRTIATAATVAALSVTSVASAATGHAGSGAKHPHAGRSASAVAGRGHGTPVPKHLHNGPTVMRISAFPAGGKGSGTEATCALWSGQLNMEQGQMDAATEQNDLSAYQEAQAAQDADVENALDAGCAVIY